MAHEIRNALTPLRAALGVLERQMPGTADAGDRARRALNLIRQESDRMGTLAEAFSEFSRFPDRRPIRQDLAGLAENVAREEIPERIHLEVSRPPGTLEIEADADEFTRLLRNLVRNAVQAIETSGTIRLALETTADGRAVRILIEDDGCGMDEETLRKVFQPGFTTKPSGSGLGLALVRRSLSHYGGSIRLESSPGGGTRCEVRFPTPPAPEEATPHAQARSDRRR
jgi:signal transduction histidine kinase